MSAVYEWVRNITYYMIFITVAGNLLADSKYEKYLRFFAGMVLILLVLKPLTGGLRLDERIAYLFESITFQKEADDFKEKLWGMEDQRFAQVMGAYEDAVAMDLRGIAGDFGFTAKDVRVTIASDRDDPMYGHVTDIYMKLGAGSDPMGAGRTGGMAAQPVVPGDGAFGERGAEETNAGERGVGEMAVGEKVAGEMAAGEKVAGEMAAGERGVGEMAPREAAAQPSVSPVGIPAQQIRVEPVQLGKEEGKRAGGLAATFPADPQVRSKINGLIRKVAGYYGLETAHVQVEWEDD